MDIPRRGHCGGKIPKPGQDKTAVPRYHISAEYPECRRASDRFGYAR